MASQYVGIDLHRRRSVIVGQAPDGQVVDTVRIDNDPVALGCATGSLIEAVIGDLDVAYRAEVLGHLEGWRDADCTLTSEPDGDGIEPIVRVRVVGTADYEVVHEFAKPESEGARFGRKARAALGWVYDGRTREPWRQLAFYKGSLLDRLLADADRDPAVGLLRAALSEALAASTLTQQSRNC